ncbi:MAG: FecR domain-containing protein, partial [Motiliproteus sp.]|nr:FecR domain-containing protein [Motiliproteus sp.]
MKYQTLKHFSRISWLVVAILFAPTQTWAQEWVYVVSEGDNLWDLSEKHLDRVTRFEQVRRMNHIKYPKRLQPGTRIRIPMKWIRSNPVPAKIVSIQGSAQITPVGERTAQPLAVGNMASLGDEIRTDANTTVAIQFADGSILTLHNSSQVRFDHLSAHGSTGMVDSRLRLLKGRMDTKVTPAKGPGSRFEIHTPSAISAVRGTVYRAAVKENGKTSNIEVLHGKVAVTGAKQQRLISAGFGTQVSTGKQPLRPRQLLPKPELGDIPERIREINWRVTWKPLKDAVAYRVEIANDRSFDTVVWQQRSEHNRSAIPDLPDGTYFVRGRGIDSLGLEGLNQTQ